MWESDLKRWDVTTVRNFLEIILSSNPAILRVFMTMEEVEDLNNSYGCERFEVLVSCNI